jgi:hypothetical protein
MRPPACSPDADNASFTFLIFTAPQLVASGKTQLCLSAAASAASRGEQVIYMDTGNSFSAVRMAQLLDLARGRQLVRRRGK